MRASSTALSDNGGGLNDHLPFDLDADLAQHLAHEHPDAVRGIGHRAVQLLPAIQRDIAANSQAILRPRASRAPPRRSDDFPRPRS